MLFRANCVSWDNRGVESSIHAPAAGLSRIYTKKASGLIQMLFSADGETRTHTGQRPLPPQSSVSTISPHPHVVNDVSFTLGLQR